MAKVGTYGPGAAGGNPDDEATPINKNKFKEELKKVDAVDKTDPDQKSKKRKPGKEEEVQLEAEAALIASAPPPQAPSILSAQAPSQDTTSDTSVSTSSDTQASQSYLPKQAPLAQAPPQQPLAADATSSETDIQAQEPQEMDFNDIDFDYPQTNQTNNPPPSQAPSSSKSKALRSQEPSDETKEKKRAPAMLEAKVPGSRKTLEDLKKETLESLKKYEHTAGKTPLASDEELLKIEPSKPDRPHILPTEELKDFKGLKQEGTKVKKTIQTSEKPLETKPSGKKESKESKKSKEPIDATAHEMPISAPPVPIAGPPPIPEAPASGSYLSPQVHELFQTMVGLVMVKQITDAGQIGTEMEVSLNNPEYEKSLFYGLTIKITEFKSAPGSYNIELIGNSAQGKLLTQESRKLISAFQDNRYNLPFTVNRLDISLKKEDKEYLFKRKESVTGDGKNAGDQQSF